MGEAASNGKKPKVSARRYLRPDEAHRLIEAAGQRGRYQFRDKVLVRLVYRHGLRAKEAVNMRWSQIDLEAGVIHIARLKGSNDSTHTLDRDELRDLRKLRQQVTGLYVFETERGGPLSVDAYNTSSGKPASWLAWMSRRTPTCCVMPPATCWPTRALIRGSSRTSWGIAISGIQRTTRRSRRSGWRRCGCGDPCLLFPARTYC